MFNVQEVDLAGSIKTAARFMLSLTGKGSFYSGQIEIIYRPCAIFNFYALYL
jgi:hypothetical protein